MTPERLFQIIDFTAKFLPERLARGIFAVAGTVVGWSNYGGVQQLRTNYDRIDFQPSWWKKRSRSALGMRHYYRYFYEAFRLPYLSQAQLRARVSVENIDLLRQALAEGSVSGALMHMGNWDLAGAWAAQELGPVHTVAEKLTPETVAQQFLSLRRSLGMVIYHAVKDQHVIDNLTHDMLAGSCFVPLLCDRDLRATGVEVPLCGHSVRVAPGPAILAQRTGRPMFPVMCLADNFKHDRQRVRQAGTTWGIKIIVGDPIWPAVQPDADKAQRLADVHRMMEQWAAVMSDALPQYVTHWHMLQKVFVEDLDRGRLARTLKGEK
ncbi:phosphatidylinositol mannoside acyltransferase [Arcanobacterium buesumense]|uniref:Phosphatidylinositol mannoside acyltransferase n=1 Tax=Arcanobacterium buesumense TaxID=2722751 RepID=A0A6H2ELD8_9ACTO|nr:phosphatidylinositol mannoside acyltransferase [Arcanobacterium buesumense]QJC21722.1 phosphatidylinositol mannoside acyltransferase [Arcanobacterium buesumense]